MLHLDQELLHDFVAETTEHVVLIERSLLALERAPERSVIDAIFRAAHSIKGTAGLFGFDHVLTVAHAMETVLGRMRSGELLPQPPVVSALLEANERLSTMVNDIDQLTHVPSEDVLVSLNGFQHEVSNIAPTGPATPTVNLKEERSAATVRVRVAQLDRLVALAGQLTSSHGALFTKALQGRLDEVIELAEQVDTLAAEVQETVLALRAQPVGTVLGKFRRMARDLAISLHKTVDLEIEGEQVEVERTVLEAIADPVAHLVRNAIDHGIEEPAARRAAGKSEVGLIRIRASADDSFVTFEVEDDGRGIDPRKIASAALRKGWFEMDRLALLSDEELIDLIFEPGFSTLNEASSVSGRGVGMDVVRANVQRVGGTIEVHSLVGRGTRFVLRLPLG